MLRLMRPKCLNSLAGFQAGSNPASFFSTSGIVETPEKDSKSLAYLEDETDGLALSPLQRKHLKSAQMSHEDWDRLHLETKYLRDLNIQGPDDVTPRALEEIDQLVHELITEVMKEPESKDVDDRKHLQNIPLDAEEFFLTRPHNTRSYDLLLKVHASKHKLTEGLKVYERMSSAGVVPDIETFLNVFGLFSAKACKQTVVNVSSHHYTRFNLLVKRVKGFWNELKKSGIEQNVQAYGAYINALGNLEHVDEAFKVFEEMTRKQIIPNEVIYTSLIMACHRAGQPQRATETYKEMFKSGITGDLLTFNSMIRSCGEEWNSEGAIAFFHQMEVFGIEPSLYTYTNLIYACAQRADYIVKAFEYYDRAMANGFRPDAVLLNILMNAASRAGDLVAAETIFKQFKQYGVQRDVITYNTYLWVVSRTMGKENLLRLGDRVWTKRDRLALAEDVFAKIEKSGLKPDRRTLNNLLGVYCNGGFRDEATNVISTLFRKYDEVEDYFSFMHMIRLYKYHNDLRQMLLYFSQMKALGIQPAPLTYHYLLKECRQQRDTFAGVAVLREMAQKDFKAYREDAFPFAHLIQDPLDPEPLRIKYIGYDDSYLTSPKHKKELEEAEVLREKLLAPQSSKVAQELAKKNWGNDPKFHPLNPYFAEAVVQSTWKPEDIRFFTARREMKKKAHKFTRMRYRL